MIRLTHIQAQFVDRAWRDGAHMLGEACKTSGGEITGDQLKLLLSRGERTLISMDREGETTGWGVVRVDQLPNCRVLMVTDMYAPGAGFGEFFGALKGFAEQLGCSRVRCAAKPAQARLYKQVCGFEPVYTILEVAL